MPKGMFSSIFLPPFTYLLAVTADSPQSSKSARRASSTSNGESYIVSPTSIVGPYSRPKSDPENEARIERRRAKISKRMIEVAAAIRSSSTPQGQGGAPSNNQAKPTFDEALKIVFDDINDFVENQIEHYEEPHPLDDMFGYGGMGRGNYWRARRAREAELMKSLGAIVADDEQQKSRTARDLP
ncbi:hypothetical protein VNI00_010898 [Paramarasmius palmivorus]|uniref:Uncharacterized protein n=1 Tax=Paramarasmius palmivorus TaxID=297713 RepID=A0AAW0CHS1_9AGAR